MGLQTGWLFLLMLLPGVLLKAAEDARLWVYAPANFQVDASTDKLLALLKRAKAAGYDGAVVTDYKFGKIDGRIDRYYRYYRNLERTRTTVATSFREAASRRRAGMAPRAGLGWTVSANRPTSTGRPSMAEPPRSE
jgi:hypothetical protein